MLVLPEKAAAIADVWRQRSLAASLRHGIDQRADRKADHIGVIAVDSSDERSARALDGVAARPLAPLAEREIPIYFPEDELV